MLILILKAIYFTIFTKYLFYILNKNLLYQALKTFRAAIKPNSNIRILVVNNIYKVLYTSPLKN